MRFHFLGGAEPAEWLLAEVSTLAQLTSVRTKLLAKEVCLRVAGSLNSYEKIDKQTQALEGADDAKAAVAALHFVLSQAAANEVKPDELNVELQQLGLPRENAAAVARAFRDAKDAMAAALRDAAPRLPAWRVDEWEATDDGDAVCLSLAQEPCTGALPGGTGAPPADLRVDADSMRVLLAELKGVRAAMERGQ